jgi:hypothetical protein
MEKVFLRVNKFRRMAGVNIDRKWKECYLVKMKKNKKKE